MMKKNTFGAVVFVLSLCLLSAMYNLVFASDEELQEVMEENYCYILQNAEDSFEPNGETRGWFVELIDLDLDNSSYPALIVCEMIGDNELEVPKYVYEFNPDEILAVPSRYEIIDNTSFYGYLGIKPYYDKNTGHMRYFLNMTNFEYLEEGDPLSYAKHKGIAELLKRDGQYYLEEVLYAPDYWGVTVFDEDEYEDVSFGDDGTLTQQQADDILSFLNGFEMDTHFSSTWYYRGDDPDDVIGYLLSEYYEDTGEEGDWDTNNDNWTDENWDDSDILSIPGDYDQIIRQDDQYSFCKKEGEGFSGAQDSYGIYNSETDSWGFPMQPLENDEYLVNNLRYHREGMYVYQYADYKGYDHYVYINGNTGKVFEAEFDSEDFYNGYAIYLWKAVDLPQVITSNGEIIELTELSPYLQKNDDFDFCYNNYFGMTFITMNEILSAAGTIDDYQSLVCWRPTDNTIVEIDDDIIKHYGIGSYSEINDDYIYVHDLWGDDENRYYVIYDWNGTLIEGPERED